MLRQTRKTLLHIFLAVFILALAGSIQYLSSEFPQLAKTPTATYLKQVLGVSDQASTSPLPSSVPTLTPPPTPPLPTPLASPSAQVKVVSVVDGDTIRLETGQTVRYIGMDTPETKHPTIGVECFGREASQRNTELVKDQYVTLEKDVSETDRYGRLLRYVWLNGVLINRQLVEEGYATAVSYPPDVARQPELRAAEQTARQANRGLWAACPT